MSTSMIFTIMLVTGSLLGGGCVMASLVLASKGHHHLLHHLMLIGACVTWYTAAGAYGLHLYALGGYYSAVGAFCLWAWWITGGRNDLQRSMKRLGEKSKARITALLRTLKPSPQRRRRPLPQGV